MGSALLEADFFQYICDGIADRWGRGKRQVDDTERNAEHLGCFGSDELAHPGNLERRLLDELGDFVQRRVLRELAESRANNARPRDTDIEHNVRLANTVECSSHERVVLWCVAEYDELRGTYALIVLSQLRRLANDISHDFDRIHVDASLGRADVHGRAHELGLGESARD